MRPAIPGLWWVVFGVLPLWAACAPVQPAAAPPPPPPPVDVSYPGAKLVVGSPDLLGRVVLTQPQFRKEGRLTESVVTVQNLTPGTYVLEYLFEWEDDAGFRVDEPRVWQQFTLTPYQITKLSSTGPAPQATRIMVTIRHPERKL